MYPFLLSIYLEVECWIDQRHVLEEMEESATLITDNGKGFREAGKLAPSLK